MKKIWKWILGIVLVLVVLTALLAIPFVMRNRMAANFAPRAAFNNPSPRMGGGPGADDWNRSMPGGFKGGQHPMMGGGRGFSRFGRGFSPFAMGFAFLGGLFRLALGAAVLYGAYWFGKRSGTRAAAPIVPAPVTVEVPPAQI